jgi:predicted O-linked N-acetylglucosamine transferase (SPINDLY family)/glycosyltransferase involved in cell wall biosynthesis
MPDIRAHTLIQCLTAIAQHHGLPIDLKRLIDDYALSAEEPDAALLLRMASDIGLSARACMLSWKELLTQQGEFPLLARLTNGKGMIVVGARFEGAGKVATLDPLEKQTKVRWLGRQPFCRFWRGEVVFLKPRPAQSNQDKLIEAIGLQQQDRLEEATRLFREVLSTEPNHPAALYSLAVIALNHGNPVEALGLTASGIPAAPDFAPLQFAHGAALQALGRKEEALHSYDEALRIQPDYIEVLTNSGVLLRDLLRHHEAIERFNRVLIIDPNSTSTLANCAILLTEFKQSEQAIAMFERLLELNPDYDYGLGLLCYERLHICDWKEFERLSQEIIKGIRAGWRACKTLALMAISDSVEDHFKAAKIFAASYCPRQPVSLWQGEGYHHDKIRIAYVSPDLREHPVGHLMAGIFEHHDKSRFETIAISLGIDDHSRLRERMLKAFDHFIDARVLGSQQIAEKMREMEVDIAIDLAGYTSDSRIDVFAYRPAPVQVGYLGYPGTSGTDYIDYIIADRHVIPEEHRAFYSEQVVYLPDTYLPTDASLTIAEQTPTRAECGLPETGCVFCSFSHDYKISPPVFNIWMRLLDQVPGSVLWLMSRGDASQHNLRREAEQRGIDPLRLIFASRVPRIEDHLARYRQADLFLDTHPYNAHTTAADALMAGLPVITYMGNAFPARVAGSLLYAIGLPELITHSLEDYEALALSLATHPERLADLKRRLLANRMTHPLFDTERFCRNLEALYLEMWQTAERTAAAFDATVTVHAENKGGIACVSATQADLIPAQRQPGPKPTNQEDASLSMARDLFQQGNLPQAEIYARHCLVRSGNLPHAAQLLEDVRRAYGFPESFEFSERSSTGHDNSDRFLLIKAWGYGFWSEVHHLMSQLLLAELTQRTPIILWGTNCLFRSDSDTNAFNHYFQEITSARLEEIPRSATIYPPKWSWKNIYEENINKWDGDGSRLAAQYLFDRSETLLISDFYSTLSSIVPWISPGSRYYGLSDDALYAELFQKYLKPIAGIGSKVDDFFVAHMQGRPWVGIHVRASDKINESPHLAQTNANYFAFIDRIVDLNPAIGVFLLTDSTSIIDEFAKRYGERLLCTAATRSASNIGVHMSGHNGVAIGEEVLIDALLATKCDYFVGNQESNVSLAIASLRHWSPGFIFLLGEKSIRGENLFLHQREKERESRCRLCGSSIVPVFSRQILCKHPVTYSKCGGCGSLQTEAPYWLDEAYAQKPERFDTGKASRTLTNFLLLRRLFEILGIHPHDRCADFGGGTGLFARLMRDIGYNYYSYDKYGSGEFCDGFGWERFDRPVKLVTIFECAEHFSDPATEWEAIFATGPDFIIGTTGLYTGQGVDWIYLSPESGQHVFFYSPNAFAYIAGKHGWFAYILGGYFLLSKAPLSERAGTELGEWSGQLRNACNESFQAWLSNLFEFASRDNQRMTALARLRSAGTRIALDGFFFRFATGISRLWKSLLAEWSANGFGEFIVVIDRVRTAPRFAGITYIDAPQHNYADRQGDRRLLQDICDRERISLFISTYYTTPLTTRAVLLVPDMIPEVMGFDLENAQWREKHDAIRYCHNYLTISNSTAADLCRFFPQVAPGQVVTAYCGTDFRTPATERVKNFKERYGIDRPYFLISGVKGGYKNALLFFQSFTRFGECRADYAIVCTNSPPTLEPEFAACVGDAKVYLLVLSDDDLQCAYAGAAAMTYPSRYEGFGLPVLEAMACSCPVITCNNSSIGEVAGDASIYVNPDDPEAMYQALVSVQQESLRDELIRKGHAQAAKFSWRKMADEVESALSGWALPDNAVCAPK